MNTKYVLDNADNIGFMRDMTQELLSFGRGFLSSNGGSYYLGDDGTPWKDRNIETWITCRMVHVYSISVLMGNAQDISLVNGAVDGLLGALKDDVNGGWYAGLTPSGEIVPTKQCYAHAFVILAATSALLAGADRADELLREALSVYDRFFWNEKEGLACDTYNTEFTQCDSYRGINANMHTVEAFLAVADVCADESYRVRAGRIIDHVIQWAKNNDWRIPEHFHSDWTVDLERNIDHPDDPFKPYGATPGHGIEWSRLITQWAVSTGTLSDSDRAEYIEVAEKLYNRAISDGWNSDGDRGIVYTTDWQGKPVVRDRMHWTLAEAINSAATLYRVTNKEKYLGEYGEFQQYLDEVVHDRKNGSWFHQLDENNKLKETVWPGKSDLYHALQSTLIPYEQVGVSIAKAVSEKN